MDLVHRYPHVLLLALIWTAATAIARPGYQMRPEPLVHNFALVIDCSGSMQGQPLAQAAAGVRGFVAQMSAQDRAAILPFSDKVHIAAPMTTDRRRLERATGGLHAGGATALYDAIVRAAGVVLAEQGAHIIVFLTDGADTGSLYSLADIRSLGLSEGVLIYGIGLGDVDAGGLSGLTQATGGRLLSAPEPGQLQRLYAQVLEEYYRTFAARMAENGACAIRSLPEHREVRVDGTFRGRTPLKLDDVPEGEHAIEVVFERGTWRCDAVPVRRGYRTIINARAGALGDDLWVSASPHGAVVFLDGTYVGTTSLEAIVRTREPGWGEAVKRDSRHLRVPLVPRGKHVLRVVAMPDFDFGPEQELEFAFDMKGHERVLQVDILARRVRVDDGTELRESPSERIDEQMRQLDDELDMGGDPFEGL